MKLYVPMEIMVMGIMMVKKINFIVWNVRRNIIKSDEGRM